MLKLYYAKGTAALAVHITLNELGADFEAIEVNVRADEQRSAEYLAINPKGRVPTLITDSGGLTETPAILVYLIQIYPEQNLARIDDTFMFARIQSLNSYFCSTVHVAHAHKTRGTRWTNDPTALATLQASVTDNMTDCFRLIEEELIKGPWALGDHYTIADPYLFTVTRWAINDDVNIDQFPTVARHYAMMNERPAVQATMLLHR